MSRGATTLDEAIPVEAEPRSLARIIGAIKKVCQWIIGFVKEISCP
jgi:hypothetical protein